MKDVIANKVDPHELLGELNKTQNETMDIDEMLHKGHINKKFTQIAANLSDNNNSINFNNNNVKDKTTLG